MNNKKTRNICENVELPIELVYGMNVVWGLVYRLTPETNEQLNFLVT